MDKCKTEIDYDSLWFEELEIQNNKLIFYIKNLRMIQRMQFFVVPCMLIMFKNKIDNFDEVFKIFKNKIKVVFKDDYQNVIIEDIITNFLLHLNLDKEIFLSPFKFIFGKNQMFPSLGNF